MTIKEKISRYINVENIKTDTAKIKSSFRKTALKSKDFVKETNEKYNLSEIAKSVGLDVIENISPKTAKTILKTIKHIQENKK